MSVDKPDAPAIPAVTAQSHDQLLDSSLMSAEHVARQLECIDFTRITVAEISMLGTADIIRTAAALIPAWSRRKVC